MPSLYRVRANWTGFPGGPGVSVFHGGTFNDLPDGGGIQELADAVRNLLITSNNFRPNVVTINIDPEGEVIDEATGQLVSTLPVTPGTAIVGLQSTGFAGPTGAVINWQTGTVRNGRRMRGRTFLVPLASAAFQSDGTLVDSTRTTLQNGAAAYVATGTIRPVVYGRPTIAGGDGIAATITASNVPDLAAVLRSRRD